MSLINGAIVEKFPPAKGIGKRGAWTRNDFSVLTNGGETLKCSTFEVFKADVGDEVALTGDMDDNYGKFNVKKIAVLNCEEPESGDDVQPAKPAAVKPTLAKRALATSVKPAAVANDQDREKNRSLAVASVTANLQSAIAIKAELGLETVDLIALADMIGRTISAITIGQAKRF